MLGLSLRLVRPIAIAIGVSCAMATVAHAVPITYAFTGTASGRVGGTSFVDAAFVITAVGNTADVTSLGPGIPCNDLTHGTFEISGAGLGYINSPLSIAANTGVQLLGLTSGSCSDSGLIWISGYDAGVGTYTLATGIGPLSLELPSSQTGADAITSGGTLTIDSIASMTFKATAAAVIAPVAGLWWNPGESGSGYNLDVKHGVLVVTIYGYKANGDPQWYITSGPIVNNSFTGTINKYVGGQCISCPYKGLPRSAGNDGVVAITFISPTSATLLLPGGRVTDIQPQAF